VEPEDKSALATSTVLHLDHEKKTNVKTTF